MTKPSGPPDRDEIKELLRGFVQVKEQRYEELESLGKGGFGSVVQDFDRHLNRNIARKFLHEANAKEPQFIRFLINEARLLSYLNHPGIVSIYDAFVDPDGNFCYTMQVLEGEDLDVLLARYRNEELKLPLSQAIRIFTKLCETMAYVHDKGVLHLDLKPGNVRIGEHGEVFLLDWGAARLFNTEPYEAFLAKTSKERSPDELQDALPPGVGSIPYAPIEQLTEPRENLRPSADIFSAGVLLYHMLTLTYPFDTKNPEEYVHALVDNEPTPLRQHRGDIPFRLSALCMKMLQENPEHRFQDFHEVLQKLQDLSEAGKSFKSRTFPPGAVLIHQGEHGDHALQILEGKVEISVEIDGEQKVVATRESGDVIGELAVFSGSPRTATVVALTRTVVKILTRELVEEELEKLDPWISQMIRGLSDNFIKLANQQIQQQRDDKPS